MKESEMHARIWIFKSLCNKLNMHKRLEQKIVSMKVIKIN